MSLLPRHPQELCSELDYIRGALLRGVPDAEMAAHGEGAAALIDWVLAYSPTPEEIRLALGKSTEYDHSRQIDDHGRLPQWHSGFVMAGSWVLGETDETPT